MIKVAVTGAYGMLGHDIQTAFKDVELVSLSEDGLDITDLERTVSVVREIHPHYLIHAAAFTDVDGCERDEDRALRVNALGTRNIAMACAEIDCPVIYISTDYVFDGKKDSPYEEWEYPDPVNTYGRSKRMGEQFIIALTNRFYIVRTSWLYGKNGKNFVDTVSRLLSEREEIEVVNDQIGSPTYTLDLAGKLRELLGKGYGIYHVTNSSYCSWYELAVEIANLKSHNTAIKPVSTEQFQRPAPRPSYSVLADTMLRLEGIEPLRHWKEALREYLLATDSHG